jgi:hypothetical protein
MVKVTDGAVPAQLIVVVAVVGSCTILLKVYDRDRCPPVYTIVVDDWLFGEGIVKIVSPLGVVTVQSPGDVEYACNVIVLFA